jgi:hypothetical protein
MNEEVIFEIGNIIHVRRGKWFKKLTAKEITKSYEYKMFKESYPKLCELAEKG